MQREGDKGKIFQDVNQSEYYEIIEMYATEITELWNLFRKRVETLNEFFEQEKITDKRRIELIRNAFNEIKNNLSKLLIEQYYNTGDENLFDTALMVNEEVSLDEYSAIDLDMINRINNPEESATDSLVVFYKGIFLTLRKNEDPGHHHYRIIVRDEEEVEKVNKKLNRGRQVLKIDEVTLGKKYYEGLCLRTHYHH